MVGGTVTQREIEELPNPTRSPLDLVFTLGGVSEEALSTRDLAEDRASPTNRSDAGNAPSRTPEEAGIFALSGGAAYSNNITIDGFDNNDDRSASFRFQPSLEGISEVQVITNQFSAEYGRASGGRVNIRTRAGSNKFRGRAFYFFRDESLNANTWRNNSRGTPRTAFQQHIPGFTLGGPVPFGYFKNKTYFFTSFEYDKTLDTALTDTYVPVVQNPRFAIPIPTNSGDTITNSGAVLGRYIALTDTPSRNTAFTARLDHNFTNSHNITLSYQLGRARNFRRFSGGNTLPEGFLGRRSDTDAINFTDNYVISPKAVNQLRFQYSQLEPTFNTNSQDNKPVVLLGFTERSINQTLVVGSSLGASDRKEKRWQIQDNFTYIAGSHSLKFGADVQRVDTTFVDLTDVGGTYNFTNAGTFAQNSISRYRQNFFTESNQDNTYFGIYAQDEWRIRPNFTVSYGLRYENETVIKDTNNFGPRFALAYSPFEDGKGVIRFGAGVFYNRVLLRTVDDYQRGGEVIEFDTNRIPTGALRTQYLNRLNALFPNALTPDSQIVQDYRAAGFNNTPFLRRLDEDLKIPESYQFNLGFEREIGAGFVFEANATFNRTARLWRETNINAPRVPAGFNSFTDYLMSISQGAGFNNACVPGQGRPIYNAGTLDANGCSTSVGNTVRFQLQPIVVGNQSFDVRTANNVTSVNLNSFNSNTVVQIAQAAVRFTRPDPNFTQIEQVGSIGNAWYRGLILELRSRYRKLGYGFGASFRAVYTLSKTEDDGIVNTSSAQIAGDFSAERADSLVDRRHRFALSGSFDTPWWLGKLRFSPLLRVGSGAPFGLSIGGDDADDRNLDDVNTDRPNFNGNPSDIRYRRPGEPLDQNLVNGFLLPTIGSLGGNLPRNAGRGPGLFIFDLSISREFKFGERYKLRPTIEFDNVLNHTSFSFGSEFINFDALSPTATETQRANFERDFLVPTRAYRPRQIRLGVRFEF